MNPGLWYLFGLLATVSTIWGVKGYCNGLGTPRLFFADNHTEEVMASFIYPLLWPIVAPVLLFKGLGFVIGNVVQNKRTIAATRERERQRLLSMPIDEIGR